MNIKFQKVQKRVAYPSDSKSRTCLAAALGLASVISFSGCDLGTETSEAVANGSSSSVAESSSSEPIAGIDVVSSSSEAIAGILVAPSSSSEVESSSSSVIDILPESGVIIVDDVSSSSESSSSSTVDIPLSFTEPLVTAGVVMVEESSSSELIESSSSSSDPLISVDPLNYGPLSGEIVIEPLSSSAAESSSSEAKPAKP